MVLILISFHDFLNISSKLMYCTKLKGQFYYILMLFWKYVLEIYIAFYLPINPLFLFLRNQVKTFRLSELHII